VSLHTINMTVFVYRIGGKNVSGEVSRPVVCRERVIFVICYYLPTLAISMSVIKSCLCLLVYYANIIQVGSTK